MHSSRLLLASLGLFALLGLSGCGSFNLFGQTGTQGGASGGASLSVPFGSGGGSGGAVNMGGGHS